MKEVLLNIIGSQSIDDMSDKIELKTVGTLDIDDNFFILNYNEEQEPPLKPVNVTVKISKDKNNVEMTRTGAFDSCLIIEKSKRNLCNYATEYGDILMGITGHNIEADLENGKFKFNYDIDVNGAIASQNCVDIDMKDI